jgi:hypothetical protein
MPEGQARRPDPQQRRIAASVYRGWKSPQQGRDLTDSGPGKLTLEIGHHSRAFPKLATLLALALPIHAQPPTRDNILQQLESNLQHYDKDVPSLFCDEHVVSQVTPGLRNQNTVTDSVFRLKRILNRDHSNTLDGQRACMNYTLQRPKRNDPNAPYVITFSTVLTPENTANCLLQEKTTGRASIDPAAMQITHLELTTPHHTIIPESPYESAIKGQRVLTVDYSPIQLDGQTFWMPAVITSRSISGAGTFHAIVWSFRATYRNFHRLEVTSRILPAGETPAQ